MSVFLNELVYTMEGFHFKVSPVDHVPSYAVVYCSAK